MLAFSAAAMLLQLAIFVSSARGSILDTAARRPVIPLLYLHLLVSVGEAAWTAIAALTLLSPSFTCLPPRPDLPAPADGRAFVAISRALLWASLALLLSPVPALLLSFDLYGIADAIAAWPAAGAAAPGGRARLGRRIERHAACLLALPPCCWGCGGGPGGGPGGGARRRGALRAFAAAIACLFAGLDLVPSDVVAGLLLLRAQQRQADPRTHARTHARTQARTHARAHTHTMYVYMNVYVHVHMRPIHPAPPPP